jgi:hypothetical protein
LRQLVQPLKAWPPAVVKPIKLQGGYFSDSTTGSAPVETRVGITIGQRGSNTRYWVEAQLVEPDDEIIPQSATVRFIVEPAALMRFAGEVEAILENGGTVSLPASGGDTDPAITTAPCAIERPYTALFMTLREECSALIERMDANVAEQIRVAIDYEAAVTWQATSPHIILAQVGWENSNLNLTWAEWDAAWADDRVTVQAEWAPTYPLDLSALKHAALATPHPRAWFESYVLYILSVAQDYLIEFLRDGSTDDIPYQRHLIYAHGTARNPEPVWVKHVLFEFDDRQQRGSTA